MDKQVLDELGLVVDGAYLVAFVVATQKAFVFRIKGRANAGREVFDYGPLPLRAGESLPTYEAGAVAVPADGVMPARSYLKEGRGFPLKDVYDETDMWYVPEELRDRIFHVRLETTPKWLRLELEIPIGVKHGRFQKGKVITGIDKDFGFSRGSLEVIHMPELRCGYKWGNDSNVDVCTKARFVYGEYLVEIPRNPDLIFGILTRRVPSHWVSMPITVYDETIRGAFLKAYGIEGFYLYRIDQRDTAVSEYRRLLSEVKI